MSPIQPQNPDSAPYRQNLKAFLTSLEDLAHHWDLISVDKYKYRTIVVKPDLIFGYNQAHQDAVA